jgi:hypothetical protein
MVEFKRSSRKETTTEYRIKISIRKNKDSEKFGVNRGIKKSTMGLIFT